VLSGVGGNTIAEAKSKLSYAEYLTWAAYRRERGSLNFGRRVEQAVGNLTYLTARINSKPNSKLDPLDFMPHEPKPDAEDTLMNAFKAFGSS